MGNYTLYDVVSTVLNAGTWSNKGTDPNVKRFNVENWSGLGHFGVLIEDEPKNPVQDFTGSIVYEKINGNIYLRDVSQAELDKLEADLKSLMESNLNYRINDIEYGPTGNNLFQLIMNVSVTI